MRILTLALIALWISTATIVCPNRASAGQSEPILYPGEILGVAPLYFSIAKYPVQNFSAILSLPVRKSNTGWYANSIMVSNNVEANGNQTFVQVGLIRRPPSGDLYVYASHRAPGDKNVHYEQLEEVSSNPHRVTIYFGDNGVLARVDGKRVRYFMQTIFGRVEVGNRGMWIQIGPAISRKGDFLSGTVSNLLATDKHGKSFSAEPQC